MRKITLSETATLLSENDNFHILTHRYPDGDTLGSAFALCFALRTLGKNANVKISGKLPSKFSYLTENYCEQEFDCDYVVSVDVAAPSLLGELQEHYGDKIDLCIDHHGSNSMVADNICVDASCAAASEIIYVLIKAMNVEITRDIANAIYTGISTDTGCFCYTNTTAQSHHIAAELIDLGCDFSMINRINFETKTRAKLKMERMVYDTMEFYCGGKCAIIYTTLAMQKALGAGDDEMEGLASIPRQIEGVKMGITMREKEDGTFKVSVRTNDGINASEFCARFGGGGHVAASGCSIKGDLATAKYMLIKAAEEVL
ncbi:MAG: bifunctional oligoribonuclease/PAP phosphatase NrnA [Eubacteriales bacterium]|nr:bifunctional oligoribonuclease/PAP phosphatase NrnA [Eubacteriales bacterium]